MRSALGVFPTSYSDHMALPPRHRWLIELTNLPTTSGREHNVVEWVRKWAARRPEVQVSTDAGGNLLLTLEGRKRRAPVIAAAHMDHPGFVVRSVDGRRARARFMGGVMAPYFAGAAVEFHTNDGVTNAVALSAPGSDDLVVLDLGRGAKPVPGDIGRWRFRAGALGIKGDLLAAPACDDLAGVASALVALDKARKIRDMAHFGVLLTRAEEEGFIGAIAACKLGTIPKGARLLSIETSRSFPDSPIGAGPIVRVGDLSSIFDHELTNAVTEVVRSRKVTHQRKLMAGGSCEATAFGAYGYRATGLCLALGNYHNMADIDGARAGGPAVVAPEVISLADFDGLTALMLAVADGIDGVSSTIVDRLDQRFDGARHVLTEWDGASAR
jgi:putative aminopeptidase FrvX